MLRGIDGDTVSTDRGINYPLRLVKPYLRPMSSMDGAEVSEYLSIGAHCGYFYEPVELIDWLNSRHFDYRGLIEKGLALEAPEWMYKPMKLVSYMYSYSGDGGLCLSNRKEWDASEGHLYFDADKWTMEKIYDTVKTLYRKYESLGHTWTLGEVIDHIRDTMVPFINETDGVYRDRMGSWESVREEKRIDPREHETIPWELNGRACNLDYDK